MAEEIYEVCPEVACVTHPFRAVRLTFYKVPGDTETGPPYHLDPDTARDLGKALIDAANQTER